MWEIERGASQSRNLVVLVGRNGVSPWAKQELDAISIGKKFEPWHRIIPVLCPSALASEIPLPLSPYRYVDLSTWNTRVLESFVAELKEMAVSPTIFLCHAKEDSTRVGQIYSHLVAHEITAWYDKDSLVVGDRWKEEIFHAIEKSDMFAIFLSHVSVKKRGFIQNEIRTAISEYRLRPESFAYLIPVRLDDCVVPRIRLDANTVLLDLQWIDVLNDDEQSLDTLTNAIKRQWANLYGSLR